MKYFIYKNIPKYYNIFISSFLLELINFDNLTMTKGIFSNKGKQLIRYHENKDNKTNIFLNIFQIFKNDFFLWNIIHYSLLFFTIFNLKRKCRIINSIDIFFYLFIIKIDSNF